MKIIISNSSNAPIYEQIKEQIKSAILSGEVEESILSAAKTARMAGLTRTEFQHIVDFILKEEGLYE